MKKTLAMILSSLILIACVSLAVMASSTDENPDSTPNAEEFTTDIETPTEEDITTEDTIEPETKDITTEDPIVEADLSFFDSEEFIYEPLTEDDIDECYALAEEVLREYYRYGFPVVGENIKETDFRQYTSTKELGQYINGRVSINSFIMNKYPSDWYKLTFNFGESDLSFIGDALYCDTGIWVEYHLLGVNSPTYVNSACSEGAKIIFVKINGQIKLAEFFVGDGDVRGFYDRVKIDDPSFWSDPANVEEMLSRVANEQALCDRIMNKPKTQPTTPEIIIAFSHLPDLTARR